MSNKKTNIEPFLHSVLVKPFKKEEIDPVKKRALAAGIALPEPEDSNRAKAGVDRGVVVKIGPTAWKDYEVEPPCKPGDVVLFTKHAGTAVEDEDGELYLLMTDQDIFGGISNG